MYKGGEVDVNNKFVALIIIILLIAVGVAYIFGTQSSNSLNNTPNITTTNTSIADNTNQNSNSNTNKTPNVKISAQQAQKIAIEAGEELGGQNDTAGTPTLIKWTANNKHTWVWKVPTYDAQTKQSTGFWYVDAMTGTSILNE